MLAASKASGSWFGNVVVPMGMLAAARANTPGRGVYKRGREGEEEEEEDGVTKKTELAYTSALLLLLLPSAW